MQSRKTTFPIPILKAWTLAEEKPVSLSPLKVGEAIKGLFAIPDPEATKPPKRKKKARHPQRSERGLSGGYGRVRFARINTGGILSPERKFRGPWPWIETRRLVAGALFRVVGLPWMDQLSGHEGV